MHNILHQILLMVPIFLGTMDGERGPKIKVIVTHLDDEIWIEADFR